MEFGGAYSITENGEIGPSYDYVPGFYDGEVESNDWEPISGYSGQYGYKGPVMHESETMSGGLEQYVWDNPGTYAIVVAEYTPDDAGEGEDVEMEAGDWVLLRKKD